VARQVRVCDLIFSGEPVKLDHFSLIKSEVGQNKLD